MDLHFSLERWQGANLLWEVLIQSLRIVILQFCVHFSWNKKIHVAIIFCKVFLNLLELLLIYLKASLYHTLTEPYLQ